MWSSPLGAVRRLARDEYQSSARRLFRARFLREAVAKQVSATGVTRLGERID
jgi:hypothetical protein